MKPIILLFLLSLFVGCTQIKTNKLTTLLVDATNEDEPVNEIEQALPIIMVIPSDNLLEKYKAIKRSTNLERQDCIYRDYQSYLLANDDNKSMISAIQDCFVQMGYPLSDLEQSLKTINIQESLALADRLQQDAKTVLLSSIHPDIIIELDYDYKIDLNSRDLYKKLSYSLSAIDAYTNKVFMTKSISGLYGSESASLLFRQSLDDIIDNVSSEMKDYFADILYKGREISVRICIEKGANIILTDECATGDTYSDWIIDYLKVNTKKGAYKLQVNTDYEISFVNVRINNINIDGTQYNAYDWARDMCKSIRKDCGVIAVNKSQGLGNILITIKGL